MKYTNRVWTKWGIVVIGFSLVASGVLIWTALDVKSKPESFQAMFWFALCFTLLGFLVHWVSTVIEKKWLDPYADKIMEEVRRAELGDEGEDGVCRELKRILGNSYSIHQNFIIPGKKFDIDAIVVGQKGIVVLEIKNYVNPMLFSNDAAYVEKDGRLITVPNEHDPRHQIDGYSVQLSKYFSAAGINNISVRKAVVFLNKESARVIGDKICVYVVCGAQDLEKYFSSLPDDPRFTPALCAQLNTLLTR